MYRLFYWFNDEVLIEKFDFLEDLENFVNNYEVEVFKIEY